MIISAWGFIGKLAFFFLNPWDRTSRGLFQTPFVTKDDLELLTLLPVPSKCGDYRRCVPPCPALANTLNIWIKNFWFTNLVTLRSLLRSALSLPVPSCRNWVGIIIKIVQDREVDPWVMMPVAKPADLSSPCGPTWWRERPNSHKLSPDLSPCP